MWVFIYGYSYVCSYMGEHICVYKCSYMNTHTCMIRSTYVCVHIWTIIGTMTICSHLVQYNSYVNDKRSYMYTHMCLHIYEHWVLWGFPSLWLHYPKLCSYVCPHHMSVHRYMCIHICEFIYVRTYVSVHIWLFICVFSLSYRAITRMFFLNFNWYILFISLIAWYGYGFFNWYILFISLRTGTFFLIDRFSLSHCVRVGIIFFVDW